MKRKKTKSIVAVVLSAIIMFFSPIMHVQAREYDYSQDISEFISFLDDKPLSIELFRNYLWGGEDMTYWEDEVYDHIKDGITTNAYYKDKLQDVLELAYQNGHCKIDFISDNTAPTYTEPSFYDTRYNQDVVFDDGDLYYAIHAMNGHLVIDATYLGNNQYEVWVAIEDYYDFDHVQDCAYGINLCSVVNALDSLENFIGTAFHVIIGFTYPLSWCPDTSSNDQAAITESSTESMVETASNFTDPQAVVSQYFWKSDYNEGWYEGEWSNGQPNGYGKLTYDDFSDGKYYALVSDAFECKAIYYEGWFSDGYRNGEGTVVYENGYKDEGIFYGSWQDGKVVFQGKRWLINERYNGYWPVTITASGTSTSNAEYGSWQSVK